MPGCMPSLPLRPSARLRVRTFTLSGTVSYMADLFAMPSAAAREENPEEVIRANLKSTGVAQQGGSL